MNRIDVARAIEAKRKASVNYHVVSAHDDDDIDALVAEARKEHPFQRIIVQHFVSPEYVRAQRQIDEVEDE